MMSKGVITRQSRWVWTEHPGRNTSKPAGSRAPRCGMAGNRYEVTYGEVPLTYSMVRGVWSWTAQQSKTGDMERAASRPTAPPAGEPPDESMRLGQLCVAGCAFTLEPV